MTPATVVLDSGPLGLILQRRDVAAAEACRRWLRGVLASGRQVIVPEVADYEVRRELLRIGRPSAVAALDAFADEVPGRYLPLTTAAMRRAAELWADVRRLGLPTADRHALDGDVILAAQVLTSGREPADVVVATTNLGHLARVVHASLWTEV